MTERLPKRDHLEIKLSLILLGVIVAIGSVAGVLTKYWDSLPVPPQSHEIQFIGEKSMDFDRWSAVLMRVDFDKMKSQDKMPITHVTFYASDASTDEVVLFYRQAMDTPWYVVGDKDVKGRHVIIYREMITGDMRIITIEKRLTRDAENHVAIGTGSIIGTAELNN